MTNLYKLFLIRSISHKGEWEVQTNPLCSVSANKLKINCYVQKHFFNTYMELLLVNKESYKILINLKVFFALKNKNKILKCFILKYDNAATAI